MLKKERPCQGFKSCPRNSYSEGGLSRFS